MAKHTTIYIDVDGVINVLSKRPPRSMTGWEGDWSREPVTTLGGDTWPIHWSHELVDHLNALADREDVTIKWLTTWEHSAPRKLSPVVGINGENWEVLEKTYETKLGWHSTPLGWWKFDLIRYDIRVADVEKFVWIDDDLSYYREAALWSKDLEAKGTALAISPSTNLGMTKQDIDDIIEFIDA